MTARIIDGKAFAEQVREKVAAHVARLKADHGITPGLAVVLVGEDPASQVYVRNKGRQTLEAGMQSFEHKLPAETSEADLLALVERLNADPAVHGILVQLPLPDHMNADAVINAISPAKDVDGFHISNVGLLGTGQKSMVPCTP
ncbi:bifunctional methylenetetrahydrofolate dehydrogenase/methenyltetrahydrofolate cyclohydrolase, partial [Salipiger thiooxidans]|uniref:tetrahydrofolate dehydrogenase/cyclohydrolase catalytic domain-containing protein n=1 Tax=Salipiger thiooxidans TaxID=282683 RepID=UPI001ACDB288|nr:bifunctional methylenetetrahydrofolate dehydrogenase/methenyltetrahydrofolate cyclohydrolase [Salipiger thiooxidans]